MVKPGIDKLCFGNKRTFKELQYFHLEGLGIFIELIRENYNVELLALGNLSESLDQAVIQNKIVRNMLIGMP